MAVKKNLPLNVMLVVDSREKTTDYIKDIIDKRRSSDGIKIVDYKVEAVKPLGCKTSTSDITIEFQFDGEEEWFKTKFAVELKKGTDIYQSLSTKASKERLFNELDRSKEAECDFYFLVTDDVETINKLIKKIPKFRNTNADITHFDNFMKLQEKLLELGYTGVIATGKNELGYVIRRLIKYHIKKFKLQQK